MPWGVRCHGCRRYGFKSRCPLGSTLAELGATTAYGGYSSVGRAPRCGRGCRGFESRYSPERGCSTVLLQVESARCTLGRWLVQLHPLTCTTQSQRWMRVVRDHDAGPEVVSVAQRFHGAAHRVFPVGVIGNTADSGSVVLGSSPGRGARARVGLCRAGIHLCTGAPKSALCRLALCTNCIPHRVRGTTRDAVYRGLTGPACANRSCS